jgi:hypothetical protein
MLSRCASKNIGRVRRGSTASTAGLKRSKCPGCKIRCFFSALSIRSSASLSFAASGFSTSRSSPASSSAAATSWCATVGTATHAASSFKSVFSNSSIVAKTRMPYCFSASAARVASGSTAAVNATPSPALSSSRTTRRWLRPKAPAPATATRNGSAPAIARLLSPGRRPARL